MKYSFQPILQNAPWDSKLLSNGLPVEEEYRDKCRFLYGESMGGAVALLLHKKNPRFWDGAVLVAPMCKVHMN